MSRTDDLQPIGQEIVEYIVALSDEALLTMLVQPSEYRREALSVANAECLRRGIAPPFTRPPPPPQPESQFKDQHSKVAAIPVVGGYVGAVVAGLLMLNCAIPLRLLLPFGTCDVQPVMPVCTK